MTNFLLAAILTINPGFSSNLFTLLIIVGIVALIGWIIFALCRGPVSVIRNPMPFAQSVGGRCMFLMYFFVGSWTVLLPFFAGIFLSKQHLASPALAWVSLAAEAYELWDRQLW